MRLIPLILLSMLVGCAAAPEPPSPLEPPVFSWNADLQGARDWQRQAETRLHERFVVLEVHGGYGESGGWWLYPDSPMRPVPAICATALLRAMFPDDQILLVSCNPGGFAIDTPGVLYSSRRVWSRPMANQQGPENCDGDISEFLSSDVAPKWARRR